MHVYFSGIGGAGIGPLALIAHQAGFEVSGSDKQQSSYTEYLRAHGITEITIGQSEDAIAATHKARPIDWFVYSSALPKENPDHPELKFVQANGIKHSKRDGFLNHLLREKFLKLLAIAGTHGKTTTTAMMIWLFKQLEIPVSYNVGAKLSFGEMGEYDPASSYFIYECDEYDRNFLSFQPHFSVISGIDWDHADIYPTRESYNQAFREFIDEKSEEAILWHDDAKKLQLYKGGQGKSIVTEIKSDDPTLDLLTLPGLVNRKDACLVMWAVSALFGLPLEDLAAHLNRFPGISRRFEALQPGLYTDYAHTPPKIEGALQLAHEVAGEHVIVVYEGLHNTRQHFIKNELEHMFDSVKTLYVVPSYLAREDPSLSLLTPEDIIAMTSKKTGIASTLDETLKSAIKSHLENNDLVLCLSAGGGGSLDEWLRKNFS